MSSNTVFSGDVITIAPPPRPFDPALYEDEAEDESEILDEEGRARLKLKVCITSLLC